MIRAISFLQRRRACRSAEEFRILEACTLAVPARGYPRSGWTEFFRTPASSESGCLSGYPDHGSHSLQTTAGGIPRGDGESLQQRELVLTRERGPVACSTASGAQG